MNPLTVQWVEKNVSGATEKWIQLDWFSVLETKDQYFQNKTDKYRQTVATWSAPKLSTECIPKKLAFAQFQASLWYAVTNLKPQNAETLKSLTFSDPPANLESQKPLSGQVIDKINATRWPRR